MTVLKRKLNLIIKEIDPKTLNGRYLRENLRRIKLFIDDIVDGKITVASASSTSESPDIFNRYETHLVTANGQVTFILGSIPADPSNVRMIINACEMTNGTHFTIVGKNVTFNPITSGFALEVVNEFGDPDIVLFQYMV